MSTPANTLDMHQSELEALAKSKGISAEDLLRLALSTFGAAGGRSGTGNAKKRSKAHYAKMVAARNKKRAEKRTAKIKANPKSSGFKVPA